MRVLINNDKDKLQELISMHLSKLLINKKVDLIINGEKKTGVIKDVSLETGEVTNLVFKINKSEKKSPILEETKATIGKELVVFETKNHTTVIEILD